MSASVASGVGATDDDRFLVVGGRRWRRSDPRLPAGLRRELVAELMSARRAVKAALADENATAERHARDRVHDAKVALGERGVPWWDEAGPAERELRRSAARRALRRHRGTEPNGSDLDRVAAPPDRA